MVLRLQVELTCQTVGVGDCRLPAAVFQLYPYYAVPTNFSCSMAETVC